MLTTRPAVTVEDVRLSVVSPQTGQTRTLAARHITPQDVRDDAPVLVFLHEALGSVGQWKDVPQRLCAATGLRGLVHDRIGHGASDPFEGPRTPDYLKREGEDWLPAVLKAAGITAPPVLFGHSDGGSVALYFAAAHPVAALITEAAHVFIEEITLQGIRDFGNLWDTTNIAEKLARYHGPNTEGVFRAWHDTWLTEAFYTFDMTSRLPAITCPSLIVQGENDQYGSPAQVHAIVSGINSTGAGTAEEWFLPDCGHIPHLECKDVVVARTRTFLESVEGIL